MGVIDFHMHLFSRAYFEALASQSPLPGTAADKLAAVVGKTGLELPPPDVGEHTERWLKQMERHGVEHLCAFASAPEEIPSLAQARQHAKGRITPFALVNPKVAGVAERVETLVRDQGFGGVLLFPALHHYTLSSELAAPLLAVLERHKAIAYVHCGLLVVKLRDLLGFPRTADLHYANPLEIVPAANAYPSVKFVIPHFGAGFFREALLAGAQCPNVLVDTSSSNSWVATQTPKLELREVFEAALRVFGPERVLFGTDSNVFPAGWRADRLAEQRKVLAELGVSAAHQELIFGGNAKRILAARA
jgi:predicted TIM-barrel fold metal-dependent hydrolase